MSKRGNSGDVKGEFSARLLIEDRQTGAIIGTGGATINALREETSAAIFVLKNEFKAKQRVVQVKGTAEQCAAATGAIVKLLHTAVNEAAEKKGEATSDSTEVRLLVRRSHLGAVIGKAGAIVGQIQADTGARVNNSKETLASSEEKQCSITGTVDQVINCVAMVYTRLSEREPVDEEPKYKMFVPGEPGAMSKFYGTAESREEQIIIPTSASGALIGKGGSVITQIRERSGCESIQLSRIPMGDKSTERTVTLKGHPTAVANALQLIRQCIEGPSAAPTSGGMQYISMGGGGGQQSLTTEKIVIPTVTSGAVIGKGGSSINSIKMQTGCTISIAPADDSAPDDRVVTITGTSGGVQNCITLIRHKVENFEPRE